jgi:hypothetical protein
VGKYIGKLVSAKNSSTVNVLCLNIRQKKFFRHILPILRAGAILEDVPNFSNAQQNLQRDRADDVQTPCHSGVTGKSHS